MLFITNQTSLVRGEARKATSERRGSPRRWGRSKLEVAKQNGKRGDSTGASRGGRSFREGGWNNYTRIMVRAMACAAKVGGAEITVL